MAGKMEKRTATLGLVLVVLGLVTAALAQGPRGGGRDGGFAGRPGPGPEAMGPPPLAGGASMVACGDGLFVLTGPTLLKINPKTMEVVSTKELPKPAPPADAAK